MRTLLKKKLIVAILAGLGPLLVVAVYLRVSQAADAKAPQAKAEPKRHKLAATLETTQWGWLDPNESPKLTVDSGDIVSVETMMHSHNKIQQGTTMEEIVALRKEMSAAAKKMEFERAAELRDQIHLLQKELLRIQTL